jgi:hypothetical protein
MMQNPPKAPPFFKAATSIEAFRASGLPEYAVYASARLGKLRSALTEDEVPAWDAAVAEYQANPVAAAEALRRASVR